jgi:DNA-directed RNA polymerase subunit RPC12/RpoP
MPAGAALARMPQAPSPLDIQIGSQMAMGAHATAMLNRMAATSCPRCGFGMVVVPKKSGAAVTLIVIGILTIWIFGFGLIFLIPGIIIAISSKGKLGFQCPACNFRT